MEVNNYLTITQNHTESSYNGGIVIYCITRIIYTDYCEYEK